MRAPLRMDGASCPGRSSPARRHGANAFYLVAVREGMLSITAPIASLYPVSTVSSRWRVDRERMRPLQITGLGLAAAALVLTAA